ncbi:MAG: germination protein YpeB [Caldicoprobacterales bacterium]
MFSRWILPLVLALALALTGAWGYNQYKINQQYSIHMDNIYQKSFYDLVDSVGSMETKLSKLMVSGDKGQHIRLLSDISKEAEYAQSNLGQLPMSHTAIQKAQKYLNHLSDYTRYLNNKVSDGKTISDEELKNLRELYINATSLSERLFALNKTFQDSPKGWASLASDKDSSFFEKTDDLVTKEFVNIESGSIDYPTLIYDGPFSETLNQRPKLEGKELDKDEARQIAVDFLGKDRVNRVEDLGEGEGQLSTWTFDLYTRDEPDQPTHIQVCKKGGKVVNMIANYDSNKINLDIDKAKDKARAFLEEKGFENMEASYQQQYGGISIINFAYKQDGVICYPDLIKVKISLEDGKIVGFEARNYLIAHRDRDLEEPAISMEEAHRLLSPNLELMSSRLALIPTEGGKERLCYEFKGKHMGNTYIVYIDAMTGQEADILQIIESDKGSLAI